MQDKLWRRPETDDERRKREVVSRDQRVRLLMDMIDTMHRTVRACDPKRIDTLIELREAARRNGVKL